MSWCVSVWCRRALLAISGNNASLSPGERLKFLLQKCCSSKALLLDEEIPNERIRNFSIVAHVDHGKSTLADRLLETTGVIQKGSGVQQVLDQLPVERKRGITVKAQTVTMFHDHQGLLHMLNLIDTPGHVDFSYEVSRSLAACQGVLLLVDGQQGVQAQTVANYHLAKEANLTILPVINKIDLSNCDIEGVCKQLNNTFGFTEEDVLLVSAKTGDGVCDILPEVIKRIPCPTGVRKSPLKALLFDTWYDQYRGVVCLVAIVDGVLTKGSHLLSCHTGQSYEVAEVGVMRTKRVPVPKLYSGQVGYVILGMRSVKEAHVGDTFHSSRAESVTPLPGFKPMKPMVFAGFYPTESSDYLPLKTAVSKLTLNDSSVTVEGDSSPALGQGWRMGFLGLLHMDVFQQRLEEEYNTSVLATSPNVPYKACFRDGTVKQILSPKDFPKNVSSGTVDFYEPVVMGTLIFPGEYLGNMIEVCQEHRGVQQDMLYMDSSRVLLKYLLPLNEIIIEFYSEIKSQSSGYASFDYEDHGYVKSPLVKVTLLLNGTPVDALSFITHKDKAYQLGKHICTKLKNTIDKHLFEIAIQAAIGTKVIARETIKALRKNVTAKCYGGDISRKMKLLNRQKEAKKRMKRLGNIELQKDTFVSILRK